MDCSILYFFFLGRSIPILKGVSTSERGHGYKVGHGMNVCVMRGGGGGEWGCFLTNKVHGEGRLQILSKLNMMVKARSITITQAKTVIPLKKSAFESSTVTDVKLVRLPVPKYLKMQTQAPKSKNCREEVYKTKV